MGLVTLGCPKNLVDSELMLGALLKGGYRLAPKVEDCDIAIINTCGFIRDAKKESLETIEEIIRLKQRGLIRHIVVAGCLAQKYSDDILAKWPAIDAFLGTDKASQILPTIKNVLSGNCVEGIPEPVSLYTSSEPRVPIGYRHSRYLKIAEGCSHQCTFCIIPQLRGKYRSRPVSDILRETSRLVGEGASEINLIAQDLSFYGMDTHQKLLLPELIRKLDRVKGINWIRLFYLYPSFVTEELISVIRDSKHVLRYLDIPLQHVSDRVLKLMKRGTTQEKTEKLICMIRKRLPDVSIRSTFITGFPSETEKDFKILSDFLVRYRLNKVGVFNYSDEKESQSYKLLGKVPQAVKEDRRGQLMRIQQKISREINGSLVGSRTDVIVDRVAQKGRKAEGRSYRDALEIDGKVFIKTKKQLRVGDIIPVKITRGLLYDLEGEY